MNCPKCTNHTIKNGFLHNRQRYKCKVCNYQFTKPHLHKKPLALKYLAIYLYLNRMTIRGIARTLNVSAPSVLKWIKEKAFELPESQESRYIPEVEVDEMWHYLESKKKNSGSSKRLIVLQENCSLLCVGIVP